MTEQDIIERLTAIEKAMADRGLKQPEATVHLGCLRQATHVQWKDDNSPYGTSYDCQHGNTVSDVLDKTDAWVAALPDPETAGKRRYMTKLGEALDVAREESIDHVFVAGARESMTAISEHLLPAPENAG